MYSPTRAELEIIREGLSSPEKLSYFTDYFFNKGDGNGFRFDRNFTDPWQSKLIFAKQKLIVGIMGIGTGKSLGVGMAAATWAMSTESFRFMNGANWAWQSKLMYQLVLDWLVDTPAERWISNYKETPFPIIEFGVKVGGTQWRSTLEFMSMDAQARKIFSWRGDWINLDEAALIENLDVALMNLSTRLTGATSGGREYLGRISLMTNPWDTDSAGQTYYFYDMASEDPEECLSITVGTEVNENVSKEQIRNTHKFIRDDDEFSRLIGGVRPEGKGKYFAKVNVKECCDPYLTEYIDSNVKLGIQGFSVNRLTGLGITEFETPSRSDSLYLIGDPGSAAPPARNSPVLAVIDTAEVPTGPAKVLAFWWGNGNGQITPFVDKLYEWRKRYNPIFTGVDSTGPQAGVVQLLNLQPMWNGDVVQFWGQAPIVGLDFSGGRKPSYLIALKLMIEGRMIVWPSECRGIRTQLFNYDPLLDKVGEPKIAQDIVATLAMAAHVIRINYGLWMVDNSENEAARLKNAWDTVQRNQRLPSSERGRRR